MIVAAHCAGKGALETQAAMPISQGGEVRPRAGADMTFPAPEDRMRPIPSTLRSTMIPRLGALALALAAATAAGSGAARAEQPFASMDALSREAYAAMAAELCDNAGSNSQERLAIARRIAADTGASLDSVLTTFHNLRMVALTDISHEGCDSPNVQAMREHFRHADNAGSARGGGS